MEVCTFACQWSISAAPLTQYVYSHSYVFILSGTDVGEPAKSQLQPHYNHRDFNQGPAFWLTYFSHKADCTAAQWRLTLQNCSQWLTFTSYTCRLTSKQRILIPKIRPTRIGKPLSLSNLNIYLPHPSIFIWCSDDDSSCIWTHIQKGTLWFTYSFLLKLRLITKYDTNRFDKHISVMAFREEKEIF